jgi:hypothetical protein
VVKTLKLTGPPRGVVLPKKAKLRKRIKVSLIQQIKKQKHMLSKSEGILKSPQLFDGLGGGHLGIVEVNESSKGGK